MLSPVLFNMIIDEITNKVIGRKPDVKTLIFVDDSGVALGNASTLSVPNLFVVHGA